MTNQSFNNIFDMLTRDTIGLASQLEALTDGLHNTSFPPHNIIDDGKGKFRIELAIAGYTEDDVEIVVENNRLRISGDRQPEANTIYLHRGIASRAFTKEFILSEYVEVVDAAFKHGMLIITLQKLLPDSKKPRRIEINKS